METPVLVPFAFVALHLPVRLWLRDRRLTTAFSSGSGPSLSPCARLSRLRRVAPVVASRIVMLVPRGVARGIRRPCRPDRSRKCTVPPAPHLPGRRHHGIDSTSRAARRQSPRALFHCPLPLDWGRRGSAAVSRRSIPPSWMRGDAGRYDRRGPSPVHTEACHGDHIAAGRSS